MLSVKQVKQALASGDLKTKWTNDVHDLLLKITVIIRGMKQQHSNIPSSLKSRYKHVPLPSQFRCVSPCLHFFRPRENNKTVSQSDWQTDRQRDRQGDGQTNWQTDRQTEKQTVWRADRKTDRRIDGITERQIDIQTNRQTGRRTDRQKTDSLTSRQKVRQTDRRTDRETDR